MAPLQRTRVTEAVLFSGSYFFGPMCVKICDGQRNVWVCLFRCLVTGAVHLELLQGMSAEEISPRV